MAMVINSNIQSLNAQRHLNNSLSAQNTATERLSSGLRINSAADDAAGLAIANRMTSQVKGLDMAIRNANDGVSMIQTAEGALSETTNILQRMRELSIQSANGIYDEGNRGTLNAEVQQLKAEIDRIAETTTFNGLNILDGSLGTVGLQIGEKANQTIDLNIQAVDTKTLGMGSTSVDVLSDKTDIAKFDSTITLGTTATGGTLGHNDVMINGQSIMKTGETFDGSTDNMEDLLEKINDNVNGVTATSVASIGSTSAGTGELEGAQTLTLTVLANNGESTVIEIKDTTSLQNLADKINDQSGGRVSANIDDQGQLSLTAENSSSIQVAMAGNNTAGDVVVANDVGGTGIATTNLASLALTSDNADPITIERGSSGNLDDLKFLGFRESNEAGTIEGTAADVTAAANALAAGDLTLNGVAVGASEDETLAAKINAINEVSEESGVTAAAFTTATLDFSDADVSAIVGGDVSLNGSTITFAGGDSVSDILGLINAETADTGITATQVGQKLILEGEVNSINFGDSNANTVAAVFVAAADVYFYTGDQEIAGTDQTTEFSAGDNRADGGILLQSENGNPISVKHKDDAAKADTGLLDSNAQVDGKFGAAVNSLDISTAAGANKAIEILDTAIQTVSDVRGDLGAVTNRLNYTVSNLANVSENASAAKSRIMDADFAAESANLSRAQVLQQAGNAMLAQANSRPQQVLSLLQ